MDLVDQLKTAFPVQADLQREIHRLSGWLPSPGATSKWYAGKVPDPAALAWIRKALEAQVQA